MMSLEDKQLLWASLEVLYIMVAKTRERASQTDTVFVQSFMDQIRDAISRCERRLAQEPISPADQTADPQGVKVVVRHNHRIGEQKHD